MRDDVNGFIEAWGQASSSILVRQVIRLDHPMRRAPTLISLFNVALDGACEWIFVASEKRFSDVRGGVVTGTCDFACIGQ